MTCCAPNTKHIGLLKIALHGSKSALMVNNLAQRHDNMKMSPKMCPDYMLSRNQKQLISCIQVNQLFLVEVNTRLCENVHLQ